MVAGYVIVDAVAAACFALAGLLVVVMGFTSKSFTRQIRYFLLILTCFLMATMHVAMAGKQDRTTRTDGHVVWWTRYAFYIPSFLVMGIYLVMTLTANIPTTLFGGLLTGGAAAFLLFGALSVGNMVWIWFIVSGGLMALFVLFMIVWVPPMTKAVYNRGGVVERIEAEPSQASPLKRWVVRFISMGFFIYLMFYGLDTTWGDVDGFTPLWDALSQAIWNGIFFALLLVTFIWPINAEDEIGDTLLGEMSAGLVSSQLAERGQSTSQPMYTDAAPTSAAAAHKPAFVQTGEVNLY